MSWLRTIVDVADLAVGVNNAVQLSRMQEMGQQVQAVEALRSVMREYIFRMNEAKEDLLLYKKQKPIAVVAGLYYLEAEIDSSPVKPEIFEDISDKEYISSTVRSIRQERMGLLELFTEEQHDLAKTTARALGSYEELIALSDIYDGLVQLSGLRDRYNALEKEKPKGFLANLKRNDWFDRQRSLKEQISATERQLGEGEWEYLVAKYDVDSKEDCLKQQAQTEALILHVFGDTPVPQVSLAQILSQKLELPEGGAQTAQGSPAAAQKASKPTKVECRVCGYQNSKHRTTCKNCRASLE